MKYFYLGFLFLFYLNAQSQYYLDFHFKSKEIKGEIIVKNENDTFFATSQEIEGNFPTPPSSLFLMFSYLMVSDTFPEYISSKKYAWDGVNRFFFNEKRELWNKNTNLTEAFLSKNDWFFQEMLRQIPSGVIKEKLHEIEYTHAKWNEDIPYYWQFGGMLATPEQTLSFLKKLVNLELPFSQESQKRLLHLIKINEENGRRLYGMDAYTIYQGERVEWFVGFYEKGDQRYYFSIRTYFSIEKPWDNSYSQQKYIILSEVFDSLDLL